MDKAPPLFHGCLPSSSVLRSYFLYSEQSSLWLSIYFLSWF